MLDAHGCANRVAIGFGSNQAEANAVVAAELIITIKGSRTGIGCDQGVEVPVAVEVAVSQSASDLGTPKISAHLSRYIPKPILAGLKKKLWRLRVADVAANVAHRLVNMSIHREQVEP